MMDAFEGATRIVRFDDHMARRGKVVPETIEEVKAWRTREAAAAGPQTLKTVVGLTVYWLNAMRKGLYTTKMA